MKRAKIMLGVVAFGLFVSGVTVWPAIPELKIGLEILSRLGFGDTEMHGFCSRILHSLQLIDRDHPQIMYGYDWLAFAHIMLAVLFAGAIRDPIRNIWIVQCGLIMCASVPVLAAVCIPIREIPWFWFLIDFSFAPAASIPLIIVLLDIRRVQSKAE